MHSTAFIKLFHVLVIRYYLSFINLTFQLLSTFPTSLNPSKLNQNFQTSSVNSQFQTELPLLFPISARTFQLHSDISNLIPNFSTSSRTFQLRTEPPNLILSNFSFFPTTLTHYTHLFQLLKLSDSFQLQMKLSNFIASNLKLSNSAFFPTTLNNYFISFFISKWRNINRSNIGRTSITSWLGLAKIQIFTKLYLDFAMDSGKNGQNHGYHVIEHPSISKSRGDYFLKKFSFFWDSIWDMLLYNSLFKSYCRG